MLSVLAGAALFTMAIPCLAGSVPVYPGATYDAIGSAHESALRRHAVKVYLSRDSLNKVRDWYQPRLSKRSVTGCTFKNPKEGCGAFKRSCESATGNESTVQCTDEIVLKWNFIPPGASMVDAFNAGVHLRGREPLSSQDHAANRPMQTQSDGASKYMSGQAGASMNQLDSMEKNSQAMGNKMIRQMQDEYKNSTGREMDATRLAEIPDMPFKGLKQEVISGRHSQKELDSLYRRYGWLSTAYYPMKKSSNGAQAYDHWLVARTQARIQKPQKVVNKAAGQLGEGAAQVGARMQQLIAQGRMGEARKLGEQMASAMQGSGRIGEAETDLQSRDHWQQWVAVLKQLALHAYKTRIIIDRL